MLKTITATILVSISLTGCASSIKSQCDPDKNYIISNPEAMEEYKELRRKGIVKNYYFHVMKPNKCITDGCINYNKNFDFIEQYFNDEERKGVYTIKATKHRENNKCMRHDIHNLYKKDKYCYLVRKNENNKIKSRYEYLFDNSKINQTVISFIDLEKNIKLYEASYQIYLTGAIGGPGYGTCPPSKINNPNYKFNAIFFHTENY